MSAPVKKKSQFVFARPQPPLPSFRKSPGRRMSAVFPDETIQSFDPELPFYRVEGSV